MLSEDIEKALEHFTVVGNEHRCDTCRDAIKTIRAALADSNSSQSKCVRCGVNGISDFCVKCVSDMLKEKERENPE